MGRELARGYARYFCAKVELVQEHPVRHRIRPTPVGLRGESGMQGVEGYSRLRLQVFQGIENTNDIELEQTRQSVERPSWRASFDSASNSITVSVPVLVVAVIVCRKANLFWPSTSLAEFLPEAQMARAAKVTLVTRIVAMMVASSPKVALSDRVFVKAHVFLSSASSSSRWSTVVSPGRTIVSGMAVLPRIRREAGLHPVSRGRLSHSHTGGRDEVTTPVFVQYHGLGLGCPEKSQMTFDLVRHLLLQPLGNLFRQ